MGVTQFQLATTPTGSVANTGTETTNNVVATSQVPPRLNLVPISLVQKNTEEIKDALEVMRET